MTKIEPKNVHSILRTHMLVDGFPMVVDLEKSQGSYLYDALEGKRYLDFFMFFATQPVGHNHPKLQDEAFQKRLLRAAMTNPTNSDFYTVEMAEFVDTFSRLAMPEYLPYLFLIAGGALAVENALKTAFDWKIRKNFAKGYKQEKGSRVIHFREAFHGRAGYTLSLTDPFDTNKVKYFPKFDWPRVLNPKITFPLNEENLKKVKEAEAESLRQIKQAIKDYPDDIAAIIIEPIQGEGGDNHFRKEFFQQLRTIADENDILLIFDEVQTGVGLTGKMWAHQNFGVQPDIMAFGKKTQVCGILASRRMDEVAENVFKVPSRLNSTWGGNLVDMVRFGKYLEIIAEENLLANAKHQGEYFLSQLHSLHQEMPEQMFNVRGLGLFIAFDMPTTADRDQFLKVLYKNGLVAFKCGTRTIRFRPALNVSRNEIDEALGIIQKSLKECF
ncbi:MAG: L-lysine 6-transaminase [candidate division KSB1 bacterium]|nr:L-lysine 6-transaminase [candidate division KSB1 bacterium]